MMQAHVSGLSCAAYSALTSLHKITSLHKKKGKIGYCHDVPLVC